MRVEILHDFATPDECEELTKHFMKVKDAEFVKGITGNERKYDRVTWRLTNRLTQQETGNQIVYPPLIDELRIRIRQELNIWNPIYDEGHGADGVVVSITFPGGNVYEHSDPKPSKPDTDVLRCNLLLCGEKHDVVVEQESCTLRSGDLMCYLVSKYRHSVPTINFTRILVMFGFVVRDKEWDLC